MELPAHIAKLDPAKVVAAVAMLRHELALPLPQVRQRIKELPNSWWVPVHFHWGMSVRNLLREKGYGELALGVNLDDVWVALVELAAAVN